MRISAEGRDVGNDSPQVHKALGGSLDIVGIWKGALA